MSRAKDYAPGNPKLPRSKTVTTASVKAALGALRDHRAKAPSDMRKAFADDAGRFAAFSLTDGDLLLDWSKCAVDAKAMQLLADLAEAANVEGRRKAMFSGENINITENRAVLHTALRNPPGTSVMLDGDDIMPEVHAVLDAMARFSDAIRNGTATGATGKKITDIVNIGIGGSDLGPVMATLALAPYHDGPQAHYVSNIDGAHMHDTLKGLNPETTLFIVANEWLGMDKIPEVVQARTGRVLAI